jgi:hypothetical protein
MIGPVANFVEAAKRLGFEWLTEDFQSPAGEDDEDSEYLDEESSRVAMLYVTMPTLEGLRRLVALWNRYKRDEPKPSDAKEWWQLFGYLSDVRTWSAKDRIDPFLFGFIARNIEKFPKRPIRLELDLWYRESAELRADARKYLELLLTMVNGRLLDFATIEPIEYQAALVEIPAAEAKTLQNFAGPIANAAPVMRVRPQSLYSIPDRLPTSIEAIACKTPKRLDPRPAIAALIDGYPIQNHAFLANRIDVEEVDIVGTDVPVSRRFHGTAMASLIMHGDLALNEPVLTRAIKVVPILAAPQGLHEECTPHDKLPLAMVYRAVLALKAGIAGGRALGDKVVLVNHSICDQEAPFSRRPSPWAKLLDYLAHHYNLLFIVSAGNVSDPFPLDSYDDCSEFATADHIERQVVILRSLERSKGTRMILSPAESINSLTIGAVHADGAGTTTTGHVDPFDQIGLTNICSGVGLGINRGIKPDLVEAGGRQFAASETDTSGVSVWGIETGDVGQLAAAPDIFGGDSTKLSKTTGTSNAAALVTRAGIRIADVLEGLFAEDGDVWVDQPTRAVILKALLTHGCGWNSTFKVLDAIYPPTENTRWARRREAITRFLGYGQMDFSRLVTSDGSRITLLADDSIKHGQLHNYSIPIPRAMIANREVRRIVMTLAWSSPIEPSSTRYRGLGVEIIDPDGKRDFWKGVKKVPQPSADAGRRGTLQHLVLEGSQLLRTTGVGAFTVGVQARAAIRSFETLSVPYALAITLEMAQPVRQDLNADVASRVRSKIKSQVPIRVGGRARI